MRRLAHEIFGPLQMEGGHLFTAPLASWFSWRGEADCHQSAASQEKIEVRLVSVSQKQLNPKKTIHFKMYGLILQNMAEYIK